MTPKNIATYKKIRKMGLWGEYTRTLAGRRDKMVRAAKELLEHAEKLNAVITLEVDHA